MTKLIELTNRDKEIISFVKEFKAVNTSTIANLYWKDCKQKLILAERRLKLLVENKKLRRDRDSILDSYYYYVGTKVPHFKHSCLIAEAYAQLKLNYDVLNYKREVQLYCRNENLKADLVVILKKDGKPIPLIIECDISRPYAYKYDSYISDNYWSSKFGVKPTIISISKWQPKSNIPIEYINVETFKESGLLIK